MRTLTPYWTTRSLTSDLMSDFTIEIQSGKNSFFEKLLGSKKESDDMKEVNNG